MLEEVREGAFDFLHLTSPLSRKASEPLPRGEVGMPIAMGMMKTHALFTRHSHLSFGRGHWAVRPKVRSRKTEKRTTVSPRKQEGEHGVRLN